jgi:hypothetical protein
MRLQDNAVLVFWKGDSPLYIRYGVGPLFGKETAHSTSDTELAHFLKKGAVYNYYII